MCRGCFVRGWDGARLSCMRVMTDALGARVCTHGRGVQVLTDWLQQAQAAKAEHQVEVAGVFESGVECRVSSVVCRGPDASCPGV